MTGYWQRAPSTATIRSTNDPHKNLTKTSPQGIRERKTLNKDHFPTTKHTEAFLCWTFIMMEKTMIFLNISTAYQWWWWDSCGCSGDRSDHRSCGWWDASILVNLGIIERCTFSLSPYCGGAPWAQLSGYKSAPGRITSLCFNRSQGYVPITSTCILILTYLTTYF